jgi:hypothetical protein
MHPQTGLGFFREAYEVQARQFREDGPAVPSPRSGDPAPGKA